MPGFQTKGCIEVPLDVFSGRVTEMSAVDCPDGVSPDEQDNTFRPGAVLTRPNLQRVLTNGPPNTTVTYQKSFVTPTGAIKNLYLFSNGQLYWEDPIAAPGIGNLLFTGAPGSYGKSATMFGREFIALSDGLHGTTVPLQWDGTYLDRVTQEGPGAVPTVVSLAPTPATLGVLPAWAASAVYALGAQVVVLVSLIPYQYTCTAAGSSGASEPTATSGSVTDGTVTWSVAALANANTLTRSNNTVTANLATPVNPPLQIGYQAQISGVPDSNSTTVNQTKSSPAPSGQTGVAPYWSWDGLQWRTDVFSGVTPLSAWTSRGFGFTIPSNATILGVEIEFQAGTQGASASSVQAVSLWNSSGQLGAAKTPGTPIPESPTDLTYGGAADQWGTALTPAIVNDPSFGYAVSINLGNRVFLYPEGLPFTIIVYYTLSGSGTVAIVESIVIDNETAPGLALVTTTEPHGLAPEEYVSIVGVEPGTVADISSAQWSAGMTTITTATNHNLNIGSVVPIANVSTATGDTSFSFNGNFVVEQVPSPNQIIYAQTPITATDPDVINATDNTGQIQLSWPVPDTPTPSYFQVESAPTPTTFYVPITYADGTWATGTVGFAWEGTFYVTAVISPTQFQYQQYGPNGSTTAIGTVTPFGQAAPGFHLMRVNFLTRQDAVLKSSPYVKFIANGGQYLQISNIPIGPENIVARILEFTGADGAYFFYLPIPAQVNGQVVSTATQINDNTTTSVLLDFSDNSLFGGLATSIPGNDLIAQIVLDGALGFGQYATRLITYGQRNRIQNFLNLGFDGGYMPSAPLVPSGWTIGANPGTLASNPALPPSSAWLINAAAGAGPSGVLSQSAYFDAYGNPILTGNTPYTLRIWLQPSALDPNLNFYAVISSALTGFSSTAAINGADMIAAGGFVEADFSAVTPEAIPTDMLLTIYAVSTVTNRTILVDEGSIIYSQTPYLDGVLFGSYGNNAEGIDGESGKFGPVTDTRKVMDFGVMRETFYMLTQEPSGRLHETTDNGTTEPSGWQVNEVGANCGALSAFSLTKSQADDTAASGGEEWMAWASLSGARIFGGSYPDKISQEIQPDWAQINPAAALTVWSVNDPVERALYFGVPRGTSTAPSHILFMSYRQLDSAQSIAGSPPFRVSFSGKLIATDNSRKWSLWNMSMNGAALMYRVAGTLSLVLGGGNGATPGVGGFGNVYTLNPNKYTDDDYGLVQSYYYTYGFVNRGAEQQLQVGSHQKGFFGVLATVTWPAGTLLVQVAPNNPANIWPLSCERTVSQPNIDVQWGYGGIIIARGSRFFLKFSAVPLPGQTDNAYNIQMVTCLIVPTRLKTRGSAQ